MKRKSSANAARSVSHQADFKKIKRKVGKKAPLKANVTNTSFATKSQDTTRPDSGGEASRAIHVPTQKLHVDNTAVSADAAAESSALTNARHLNLHDLFGQIKHYNINVRRDALLGLKDLLVRHPGILVLESASLLQMTLPCVLDEEKSVRGALLSLLQWMVPQLGAQGLQPFQGLIVSYVCSGLSHMHFAVRRSAMQTLRIVMDLEKSGATPTGSAGAGGGPAGAAAAAAAAASARLLWSNSYRQLLPNFLSCMSERVFVTKQSNIGSTELLASSQRNRGGSSTASALDAAAGSAASNLANRAMMLQCIEQYLSLCPYLNQATGGSSSSSGATGGAEGADAAATASRVMALPPHVLHSSALHSLIYPDASAATSGSASATSSLDPWASAGIGGVDSAAALQASARPVPMKYARKHTQQNKFFAATAAATAAASPAATAQSEREKAGAALSSFLSELLPLCIEYWLESFGLTGANQLSMGSGTSSSSGIGSGALTPAGSLQAQSAHNMKSKDHTDLLANLHAILRLIHSALNILRYQRLERLNHALIESGGAVSGDASAADPSLSEADLLSLPSSFPSLIRAHIFGHFPFGLAHLSTMSSATTTEQQYRALNTINAECVAIMSCFMNRRTEQQTGGDETNGANAHAAAVAATTTAPLSARRKSVSNRAAKQAAEDEQWLSHILTYMADSFQSLTDHSQAKAARYAARGADGDATAEGAGAHPAEGADMVDHTMGVSAAAPTTPARAGAPAGTTGGRSGQKKVKSSSSARVMEHGSLADLLPLLQTLLPRLSLDKQDWMIQAFANYYLSCHPLSPSKLACLRFLHDYLLVPPRGFDWLRCDFLRRAWIDDGEWTALLQQLAEAIAQHTAQLRAQQQYETEEATKGEETAAASSVAAAAAAAAVAVSSPSSLVSVSSPLLSRYCDMVDLLLDLLLNAGRIYHAIVLDYNLLQEQLLPFFGSLAAAPIEGGAGAGAGASAAPTPVTPGPFWSLSPTLQHKSLQLLYYFDSLSPLTLQVLLECVRGNLTVGAPSLPLSSRLLVLDMVEDKFEQSHAHPTHAPWPLQSYLAFILGMLRTDRSDGDAGAPDAIEPARVSPLMATACRMLRGIRSSDVDAAMQGQMTTTTNKQSNSASRHARAQLPAAAVDASLLPAPSSPGVLLELLAPMLVQCLQASMPASALADVDGGAPTLPSASAAPSKLDFLSTLLLLESLLSHSGPDAALPAALAALLPAALYYLLSSTLNASMVEGGAVRASSAWLSAPPSSFLSGGAGGQLWLLAMRVLYPLSTSPHSSSSTCLPRLLHLMHRKLSVGASISGGRDSAHQVVVVLAAIAKCARVRDLLLSHRSAVLSLSSAIQRTDGIASQTLRAALQAELTLLFGQSAQSQQS